MATEPTPGKAAPRERKPINWAKVREGSFILFSLIVSGAVGYVTGKGSWAHIVHIGHLVDEPSADWLPVAIDGMMLNGTILVAVDKFRKRVARPWAVISLWLGSVLTLAFNVASAWERGFAAMLIAVTFAVALLCTVEAVFHPSQTTIEEAMHRRIMRREAKAARKGAVIEASMPAPVVVVPVEPVPVPVAVDSTPVAPEAATTAPEPVTDPEPISEPVDEPVVPVKTAPRRKARATTEREGIKSRKRVEPTDAEDTVPATDLAPVRTPLAIEAAQSVAPVFSTVSS